MNENTISEKIKSKSTKNLLSIKIYLETKQANTYLQGFDMQYVYNEICYELESR